jgi:hypothetical protein
MEAIAQVAAAISRTAYHAKLAATYSAAAAESAKRAARFAEMAEEHGRLAVEMAQPPEDAEAAKPAEPAEPAKPAEPAQPVKAAEPAKPAEPAAKRQRTRTNCSGTELRAEEVELLRLADEQAAEQADEQDEPHDAGEWDRYLEAGIDSHFQVEMSPSPLPLDSPFDW